MVCIDKHGPFWHAQPHRTCDTGPHPGSSWCRCTGRSCLQLLLGWCIPSSTGRATGRLLPSSSTHFCFPHCCAVTQWSLLRYDRGEVKHRVTVQVSSSQEQGHSLSILQRHEWPKEGLCLPLAPAPCAQAGHAPSRAWSCSHNH